MVIAKCQLFASLVHQIVNKLLVFAIFPSKNVFSLKDRRVEASATKARKTIFYSFLDVLSAKHFRGTIIACSLSSSMRQTECMSKKDWTFAVFNNNLSFFLMSLLPMTVALRESDKFATAAGTSVADC